MFSTSRKTKSVLPLPVLPQQMALNGCLMGEVFVDAKANLWEERDEVRKKKYDKLSHKTLPKVAHDSEARIGCKGGSKFWYGYKKHGLS